ncbi:MAG TPA: regulatory protein RecX, partial [Turneriella sp.]|nr:regulatory protein RecX [Turneriella sp.]
LLCSQIAIFVACLPLYDRAVALAARRLRSAADLKKKLIAENYPEDEVDAAITRLGEVHLIDDNLVAQSISRRYADRGNRFILQKMKDKGVADEQESAFESLADEYDRALAAGKKKLRTLEKFEQKIRGQKLYQHLALRGFAGSTVQRVVRALTRFDDD